MKSKLIAAGLFLLLTTLVASAYTLENAKWMPGTVPFYVDLGQQYNTVAAHELSLWDAYTGNTFLTTTTNATTYHNRYGLGDAYWMDGRNSMVWSTAVGETFPSNILAECSIYNLAPNYDHDGFIRETDIVVNAHFHWSSYDGPYNPFLGYDIGRVLLHEIGHSIGLGHSTNDSIMYQYVSNIWELRPDDIAGAKFLYGPRTGHNNVPDTGSTIWLTLGALASLAVLRRKT